MATASPRDPRKGEKALKSHKKTSAPKSCFFLFQLVPSLDWLFMRRKTCQGEILNYLGAVMSHQHPPTDQATPHGSLQQVHLDAAVGWWLLCEHVHQSHEGLQAEDRGLHRCLQVGRCSNGRETQPPFAMPPGDVQIQHMGMDQYLLIPFLVGWTSINPSYFDVHQGGLRFWHTAIF